MHLFLSPAPCEDVCSLKELVVFCQGNDSSDKWAPSVVALTLTDESSLGSCSMCAQKMLPPGCEIWTLKDHVDSPPGQTLGSAISEAGLRLPPTM